MNERPWLIIPVETKVREFDAKLYLACSAAEAGFDVMLGEQNYILQRLATLPRGFYFDKSVATAKIKSFSRLKKLGYRIISSCEEGLVYCSRDTYLRERISPEAFEQLDLFFAWGQTQKHDMQTLIKGEGRIVEVGNPRFDLLRPHLRGIYSSYVKDIKDRFGEFFLINTNFGRYNHFYGEGGALNILRNRGVIRDAQDEEFFNDWIKFIGRMFSEFKIMLPLLSKKFPEQTFVLRPHPSENHESWRSIAKGLENVHVVYERQSIPWIMAASAVIHNNCTTGLEAALLGRPVFAYRPVRSADYDSFLPNRVSVEVETFDQLVDGLKSILTGMYKSRLQSDPSSADVVKSYIASADGMDSTSRIVERLSALSKSGVMGQSTGGFLVNVRDQGEQWTRRVVRAMLAPLRSTGGYAKQKFPGLVTGEVEARVARFHELTGRFKDVRITSGDRLSVIFSVR